MIPLPRARTENADSPKGNSGEVSGKLRITELQPCTLSDALAKRGGMLLLDASRRIGSCPTLSMEDLAGSPQGEEVAMASLPASEINPNARESASSAPKGRIPQRRNTLMIEVEVPAQSLLRSTSFASNDGSGEAMDIATPLVSSLPRDHSIGAKKSSPTGRQAARKAQSTWTHYTFPQIDSCSDKPCSTIEGFDLSHFGRRGDVTSHRQPHIPIHPQSTPATCSTRTPDGSPKERDRSCGSMGHWLNTDSNVGDNDDFPSFGRSWRSSEERQSGLSISAQPSPIASHVPPWGVLGSRTSSSMAFSGRFPAAVPPMPASPRSPVEVPTNERVRADPRLESKPGFFARMASLALLAGFRQGSGTFSPVSTGNFGSPVPSRPEDCSARSVDSVSMRSPLGSVASRDRQPSSSPSTSPERMGGNKTRGWSPVGRLQDDSEAALEFRTGEIHSGRGPVASSSNSSRRRWTFDDLRIWNSWRSKRSYSPESISYTGGYDVSALPGDCSDASKAQSLDTFELQSSAKKAKVLNTARKSATRSAMKKSASIRAGTQHQLQQASAAEWRANEMRTRRGSLTSSFDATGSFIRRAVTSLETMKHIPAKVNIARARWVYATWWAVQEAQRRKAAAMSTADGDIHFKECPRDRSKAGGLSPCHVSRLNSGAVRIVMLFCSVYAVLGLDIYWSCSPPMAADTAMLSIHLACYLMLVAEITVWSVKERMYRFSFFFWLDLLAILALTNEVAFLFAGVTALPNSNILSMVLGGKVVRLATNLARMLHVFKAMRRINTGRQGEQGLARESVAKTLKRTTTMMSSIREKDASKHQMQTDLDDMTSMNGPSINCPLRRQSDPVIPSSGYESVPGEMSQVSQSQPGVVSDVSVPNKDQSVIGSRIDMHIAHHLVVSFGGMLAIVFALTAFDQPAYFAAGPERDLAMLEAGLQAGGGAFGGIVDAFVKGMEGVSPVISLQVMGEQVVGTADAWRPSDELRSFPRESQSVCIGGNDGTCVLLDLRGFSHSEAVRSLALNVVIIGMLLIKSLSLSTIIFKEVVAPMERMAEIVKHITRRPLEPFGAMNSDNYDCSSEIKSVERALTTLAQLLRLSFGEAGAKMIQLNMRRSGISATGENSELFQNVSTSSGKLVQAIFGFCDIRNFTDVTEALQGDVVKLVNRVAEIVHEAVIDNHGAPNKNIGDAFLLVWKPNGKRLPITFVADCALRSYVRTIMQLQRSEELRRIAAMPAVVEKFPGFQVSMGFGLHFGWAIEGAIGSKRKIDASYLSPHVNIASRLEAATKQYGVMILMSHEVHSLLSPGVQKLCRLVDRVVLKGVSKPIDLYTYDVDVENNIPIPPAGMDPALFFSLLSPRTDDNFREQVSAAVRLYLGGQDGSQSDWPVARKLLVSCLQQSKHDGPCETLIRYMNSHSENGKAPKGWKGHRELDSK